MYHRVRENKTVSDRNPLSALLEKRPVRGPKVTVKHRKGNCTAVRPVLCVKTFESSQGHVRAIRLSTHCLLASILDFVEIREDAVHHRRMPEKGYRSSEGPPKAGSLDEVPYIGGGKTRFEG